ncbi:hypothetical protein E3N88_27853 [Mikania micrantha]|uniref:Uncharacterized protein n=1 Tax=Mikania micrantha TaxID=192012 RepID=A0A5N6N0U4_9ASTR|nr:hypothetical protein E3N88_27853 [Mikania micrantha]
MYVAFEVVDQYPSRLKTPHNKTLKEEKEEEGEDGGKGKICRAQVHRPLSLSSPFPILVTHIFIPKSSSEPPSTTAAAAAAGPPLSPSI